MSGLASGHVESLERRRLLSVAPGELALSNSNIAENFPQGGLVGFLSAKDAEDPAEALSYTLVEGAAAFVISGDELRTRTTFDYETRASYSIRVRVTDSTGLWMEAPFVIHVTNVNEPPVAADGVLELDEDTPAQGTLLADDPDSEQLSFSVVERPSHGVVTIDADGGYTYTPSADYAGADGFTFTASDGPLRSNVGEIRVTVMPVNDAPGNLMLAGNSVMENRPAGEIVGWFSAMDVDSEGPFTYELVAGAMDNGHFRTYQSDLLTAELFDYEAMSSYTVRVRVTDAEGASSEQDFVVAVTNVAETPSPWLIEGTSLGDSIRLEQVGAEYLLTVNGEVSSRPAGVVSTIDVRAGAGNDHINIVGSMPATVFGEQGDDSISAGGGADLVYGGDGDDSIAGNEGVDTLYGNFGDDVIMGGLRRDSILGGIGYDSITGGDGPDTIYGGDQMDVIRGGRGADYIESRGKADTVYGGDGNDTINGGAGADLIYGETGDDELYAWSSPLFRDTIDGGAGADRWEADQGDLLIAVEQQVLR